MGLIEQPALLRRHLLTVEQYERMDATGVLAPDARVELIEGELVEMPTIGTRHASTVKRLLNQIAATLEGRAVVAVQDPLRLGDYSEPEPDLMLLRPRDDFYAGAHPVAADVLLLIEVSETSVRYDREIKLPLYARHGVAEVWIVDLDNRVLRFYRQPVQDDYHHATATATPGSVAPQALPGLLIDLSRLLG